MTFAPLVPPVVLGPPPRPRGRLLRSLLRGALVACGAVVVILGFLIAPLPGPFGLPIAVVGLVMILRNSYWAKRLFIRAQYARPRWIYPFRRLLRRKPEFGPVVWQQALRAEKLLFRRTRRLARGRRGLRRALRRKTALIVSRTRFRRR